MIKLTKVIHTLKTKSSEKLHNIEQYAQKEMYEWEKEMEESRVADSGYVSAPFIEPFEFTNEDYDTTEVPYRIRKEDILSYSKDKEGNVMLTERDSAITYVIKESIEFLDKTCGIE